MVRQQTSHNASEEIIREKVEYTPMDKPKKSYLFTDEKNLVYLYYPKDAVQQWLSCFGVDGYYVNGGALAKHLDIKEEGLDIAKDVAEKMPDLKINGKKLDDVTKDIDNYSQYIDVFAPVGVDYNNDVAPFLIENK